LAWNSFFCSRFDVGSYKEVKLVKNILLLGFFGIVIFSLSQQTQNIVQPIQKQQIQQVNPIKELLKDLGCPKTKLNEITKAVEKASEDTNINPFLLSVLIFTESNFQMDAKSKKGYVGLLQTPTATKKFADVDVLHGARILKEKLRIANGDLLHALTLYKGGNNKIARKQATQCLSLYRKMMNKG